MAAGRHRFRHRCDRTCSGLSHGTRLAIAARMKTLILCFLVSSLLALGVLAGLSTAASTPRVASRSFEPPAEPKREPTPLVENIPTVIELPELRIVASRPRRVFEEAAEKAAELVPCSGWEELGPVFSARAGEVPATRHVQRLCPRSESR
jgi:hypothetical protein